MERFFVVFCSKPLGWRLVSLGCPVDSHLSHEAGSGLPEMSILETLVHLSALTKDYQGDHTIHERVLQLIKDVNRPFPRIVDDKVYVSDRQAPHPLIDRRYTRSISNLGDVYDCNGYRLILDEDDRWLVDLPGTETAPTLLSAWKARVMTTESGCRAVFSRGTSKLASTSRGLVKE